jgi:nicotinamide mononucleotide transporter
MTKFSKIYDIAFPFVSIILCFLLMFIGDSDANADRMIAFIAASCGILSVFFGAKGHLLTFLFATINIAAYSYTAFNAGNMGQFSLFLFFYLPMQIIGFLSWKKHQDGDSEVEINKIKPKTAKLAIICGTVLAIIWGFILHKYLGEAPMKSGIDAISNATGVAAQIMLVKRYREVWAVYIGLNTLTLSVWIISYLEAIAQNQPTSSDLMILMWILYLVNSIYGTIRWYKK